MIIQECDYKFECDDLEALIEEPNSYAILSKDFLISVEQDLMEVICNHLASLEKMFPTARVVKHTELENNEYLIRADEDGQPCHVVYFKLYVPVPDELKLDDKLFQLASGSVLTGLIPKQFFGWPEEIQDHFLEHNAWCAFESEDGGTIHRMIDEKKWVYSNLLNGSGDLWSLLSDKELKQSLENINAVHGNLLNI